MKTRNDIKTRLTVPGELEERWIRVSVGLGELEDRWIRVSVANVFFI